MNQYGNTGLLDTLLKENKQLKVENQKLQASLLQLKLFNKIIEREIAEIKEERNKQPEEPQPDVVPRRELNIHKAAVFLVLLSVCGILYMFFRSNDSKVQKITSDHSSISHMPARHVLAPTSRVKPTSTPQDNSERKPAAPKDNLQAPSNIVSSSIEHYKVISKAYFHNEPDESTRRKAFITHWNNAVITPLKEQDNFIYVVFTNYRGETSTGWLRKDELMPVED